MNARIGTANALILRRRYTDIEQLGEIPGWEFDFLQLEPGELVATVSIISGVGITLARMGFNRSFHQRGTAPQGYYTFGIPDSEQDCLRWNGRDAGPCSIINFNCSDGFEGVNKFGFSGYAISFEKEFVDKAIDQMGLDMVPESDFVRRPYWSTTSGERDRLLSMLRTTESSLAQFDSMHWKSFVEENRDNVLEMVLGIVGRDSSTGDCRLAVSRSRVIERALEIIDDPDGTPPSIADLCDNVGTSYATLERAFKGEFGIAPRRYLQVHCLNGVRRDLVNTGSGALVGDIAGRWGFWHLGRFSAAYRRQFGELPSVTLSSRKK